ncbi:MAG: RrF2 family transcriptional regulator [Pseudomonadota bacterium]
MHLTLYTDYALRVLIYLGRQRDLLTTTSEIARYHGISKNHLIKVVHRLGNWGYIRSVRGRGGGIQLARAPEAINVGEVVRRAEEDLHLVDCFGSCSRRCVIEHSCALKGALHEALEQFLAVLDRYTLADFLRMPAPALGYMRP